MQRIAQLMDQDNSIQLGESSLADGVGLPLSFGHAYMTLMICLRGCAQFTLNFKEQAVRRDDVLVLAEDTIAVLRRRSRGFKVFFCLMPKSFAAEVAYALPNPLFVFLHDHPHCVPRGDDRLLVRMWLTQMWDIERHCPTYRHVLLRNQLQSFFLKIAEQLPLGVEEGRTFSRQEMLSWRFWELVGRHCTRHRDVQFYADALSITPFYLSRLTKVFFNDTPKGLIDRQVILEIKALLVYSDLPIGRVADKLHFDDASYLCRYFKRQTGVSLSGYRRRDQAKAVQD